MWRPRGCQPQDFSFCVNAIKFGTDVEKWCFYSLFYKRVCMWNKNCVRAFQFFLQKCDFRNRWKTGHTPMIVEQTVLHPMKNMCTKFQVNLFVTSRDILTSALHMSKNALLRKSRKNVMVSTIVTSLSRHSENVLDVHYCLRMSEQTSKSVSTASSTD